MLDQHPGEPRWLSWLYALLWSAIILVTVPLARLVADYVTETLGVQTFLWLTFGLVVAAFSVAVRGLRKRSLPIAAYLWLASFSSALLWLAWRLRGSPVEAFHVIQYGILSLLFYRALVHDVSDYGVYVGSTLLAGIVGILDEWLQWIIPGRFWGIRDVGIDFLAAALTQFALAAGLRPSIVSGWPTGHSLLGMSRLLAVVLVMLGLSYANTPDRIARFAARVPAMSFLLDNQSMMVEYGHLYSDPDIGSFRSRYDAAELERLDRERGLLVAQTLDEFHIDNDWRKFQRIHTVPRDAYLHEIGVHLFRRQRHLTLARDSDRPIIRRRESYFISLKENRILEKFFPRAINASSHRWTDETRREVDANADAWYEYR
ncbi:MAG: VanZ family protein, partial [Gammaproteobacteria bacterium]